MKSTSPRLENDILLRLLFAFDPAKLDGFLTDHFPEVSRRLGTEADQLTKIKLLLETVEPSALAAAISDYWASQPPAPALKQRRLTKFWSVIRGALLAYVAIYGLGWLRWLLVYHLLASPVDLGAVPLPVDLGAVPLPVDQGTVFDAAMRQQPKMALRYGLHFSDCWTGGLR